MPLRTDRFNSLIEAALAVVKWRSRPSGDDQAERLLLGHFAGSDVYDNNAGRAHQRYKHGAECRRQEGVMAYAIAACRAEHQLATGYRESATHDPVRDLASYPEWGLAAAKRECRNCTCPLREMSLSMPEPKWD
jgi:hypothetical protein